MRDKTLAAMLISVGLFNVIDYISTIIAIGNGVPEGNPVMDAIVHTPWFPVVKLLLVPLCLYFVWLMRGRVRPQIKLVAYVPLVAYGLLTLWHIYGQFFI